jgi:hypothetical protein
VWETLAAMIGAGTVISPIIKIVTTVAVLAATYFFIVAPILDTTEDTVNRVNSDIAASNAQSQADAAEQDLQSARSSAMSYGNSMLAGSQPWPAAAREVIGCVKKAGQDIRAMERCERLGQGIAHGVLSDRNFAVSYADSLASQGSTADAQRVQECIDKAGFEARPMKQCRNLADQLLFG